MTVRLEVTATQVAAAKLKIKRDRARGLPVDPAILAIAEARPATSHRAQFSAGADEARRD